jgi:hypothetical protein
MENQNEENLHPFDDFKIEKSAESLRVIQKQAVLVSLEDGRT